MALRSSKKCQEPLAQHVTYLKMFIHHGMLLNLELSPLLTITAYSLHCFMVTLYEMHWTQHITVQIVRTPSGLCTPCSLPFQYIIKQDFAAFI